MGASTRQRIINLTEAENKFPNVKAAVTIESYTFLAPTAAGYAGDATLVKHTVIERDGRSRSESLMAQKTDIAAAKARKQKMILAAAGVGLVALAVIQVPKLMKGSSAPQLLPQPRSQPRLPPQPRLRPQRRWW